MHIIRIMAAGVILCLISAVPSFAQADAANAGVYVGAGFTYLTVPKGVTRKIGTGQQVGGFIAVPMFKNIYFRPELAFQHQRSEADHKTYTADYVAIPLLVHFEVSGSYLAEGISVKVPKKVDVAGVDVTDKTQRDISLTVVGGLRRGHFGAELRWDQGFKRLAKELLPGDIAVRNRAITLYGVLSFGGHE
jgi:hypothetical protein